MLQWDKGVIQLEKNSKARSAAFMALRWMFIVILVTVFCSSDLFTIGYSSNFIYLIGYTNQLIPLFSGIIIGTVFFSFSGSFIGAEKTYLMVTGVVIAVIFQIAVFSILIVSDYVVPNNLLIICAFMLCSIFLPALQFGQFIGGGTPRIRGKIAFPAFVSVLSIMIIAYSAIIYEKSGQSNLAEIVSVLDYTAIALLATVAIYIAIRNGKQHGTRSPVQ